jgi:integrase
MKTPEPKFLLKEPKAKEPTLISMVMRFDNQRLFYSTGEQINPEDWDFKSQRVKNSKKIAGGGDINHLLDKLALKAKELFRNYKADGQFISPSLLKKDLDEAFNNKVRDEETTLLGFIESYIQECQATGAKKEGTIKSYTTTLNHLKNFKKKRLVDVEFETVNIQFYNKLKEFFNTDLNLSLNSAGKHIKNLKTFLSEATKRGINKNMAFRDRGFKKLVEDIKHTYLTVDEIERLYQLNLSVMPAWEAVRDIFVFGCYTGLRFSDLVSIRESNIVINDGKECIDFITNKTGERVLVPLANTAIKILKKYKYQLPKAICNQKFNAYLKFISQRAGFNQTVQIVRTVGGIKRVEEYKKYELITTHTARRSFATNAYLAGLPAISIMKMTGHKTEQVFMKYISISQEENVSHIKEHQFFK